MEILTERSRNLVQSILLESQLLQIWQVAYFRCQTCQLIVIKSQDCQVLHGRDLRRDRLELVGPKIQLL